jgi:hypothetical protein
MSEQAVLIAAADQAARHWRFPDIDFGFGECMDSFLGSGAFKTARQWEFLPDDVACLLVQEHVEDLEHAA